MSNIQRDIDLVNEAIKMGNITFSDRAAKALSSLDPNAPDAWDLTEVVLNCCWGPSKNNNGGFGINWVSKHAGCGRVDVYFDKETNKLRCMNEGVNKEFIKKLFCALVDSIELDMVNSEESK